MKYEGEAPEVVTYTLNLTNKPMEPKLPQTGDNMNPFVKRNLVFCKTKIEKMNKKTLV